MPSQTEFISLLKKAHTEWSGFEAEEEKKRQQQILQARKRALVSANQAAQESQFYKQEANKYYATAQIPSNVAKSVAQPFDRLRKRIVQTATGSERQRVDNVLGRVRKINERPDSARIIEITRNSSPTTSMRVIKLASEGASLEDIEKAAQESNRKQREQLRGDIGAAVSVGSLAIPVGGTVNLARGAGQAARTIGASVASGTVGGAGSELSANPNASVKDIAQSAAVGGVVGGALPIAGGVAGKAVRRARVSSALRKEAKAAGEVEGELKDTLSRFSDLDSNLRHQLQLTFGTKAKQKAIQTAQRQGVQTSRAKQFADTAQREIVEQIEADPTLARSGQVQSQLQTITQAYNRGFLNLSKVKVGEKIDAIDVARARLSMDPYLDEYSKAILSRDGAKIKKTYDELAKAREGYQVITSEAGRALNIQNTFDERFSKILSTVEDYQSTIAKGQPLTEGQKQVLNQMLVDAAQSRTPTLEGLQNAIYAGETSLIRKAEEYATAAKLTSPVTHMRNIIGNTLTFGVRGAEQGIANVIGAITGRTSLKAAPKVLGTINGYKTATAKFSEIMKDAFLLRPVGEDSADRLAREGYRQAIGGKFGEFVRIPFKFLEASDEFGKAILRDSRLNQEAFSLATKEGFKGEALVNRVDELVRKPTQQMLASAEKDALEHTFQTPLGKVGSGAQKMINFMPGGKFFVPFLRTPTNIVKFQVKRSAVGAPFQVAKAISKRGTREGDEAIARAITGTMFSLGTYQWVANNQDKITGAAPKSQAERDAFFASGKQPYSIKIGNRWVSYQSFQPVGLYLLQAQALKEAIDKNDDSSALDIAGNMVQVAFKGILELPFVQGMNNVFEALGNPEVKAEDFIASTVRGFVPNIARDVRLYTDEVIRAPKDLKEQIFDMLPGLSRSLEARRTIFGEEVKRKDSPLARSLFRVFGTTEQDAPEGLKVLEDVARETDYAPDNPSRTQRDKKLNKKEYADYQKIYYSKFKENLDKVLSTSSFRQASMDTKKDVIQQLVYISGNQARDEYFGEKPENKGRSVKESTRILRGVGIR